MNIDRKIENSYTGETRVISKQGVENLKRIKKECIKTRSMTTTLRERIEKKLGEANIDKKWYYDLVNFMYKKLEVF